MRQDIRFPFGKILVRCKDAIVLALAAFLSVSAALADDPSAPSGTVKLIFIHHSTGENWLRDDYGGLGAALANNHYYVSDTNYGWGPDSIGDRAGFGKLDKGISGNLA